METAAMWKPREAGPHPTPHLPAVSTTLGKPASTPLPRVYHSSHNPYDDEGRAQKA